ncbi:MAG: hypothetical protein KME38_25260 [Spirirestis rafaelensis WJT71-NPBG6]|jgi:tRNA C32,U32 (ribose-2'-O)-methylase TrmJ|nr:hypothetical protein [Spirirestis rafaelensis WJT71-NPBG6]
MNRNELMQSSATSELGRHAENFLEKITAFQQNYPEKWQGINDKLYQQADMNAEDLMNLLQVFSEISR